MTRDPAEGVDADGLIVTGAASERIPPAYQPIVADCTALVRDTFGARLHGLYLYGSVATGQAHSPDSDLDLLAVWAAPVDPAEVTSVEATLSDRHADLVRDVSVTTASITDVQADDRDGLGWRCFLRHYCIGLTGTDLRPTLPPCRPSRAVADAFNDDVGELLRTWRTELAAAAAATTAETTATTAATTATAETAAIARTAARKLLLVAATLESAEHGSWTTDRATAAALLTAHHPEWADVAAQALDWCTDPGEPSADDVSRLLRLGDWLATRP